MQKFLKIFHWEVKTTARKPANQVDLFQKTTAAHHPEAACSLVAFEHKKGAEVSENLKTFFRLHKFLKIFTLGCEKHSQKTSKSDGYFPENHCLLIGIPVGKMKRQKITKSPKNLKIFFRMHKLLKIF